jgi:hypothetical protein
VSCYLGNIRLGNIKVEIIIPQYMYKTLIYSSNIYAVSSLSPSVRSTNIVRTIESAKCLVAGLFQQSQSGRCHCMFVCLCAYEACVSKTSISDLLMLLPLSSSEDMVSILTTEAESEILYPNYHGCRLLKHLSGLVSDWLGPFPIHFYVWLDLSLFNVCDWLFLSC